MRGRAPFLAKQIDTRVRLQAELGRCYEEIAQLRGEIRIKDAGMARVPARRRPCYPSTERMSILELQAARVWSLEQTARAFPLMPGRHETPWPSTRIISRDHSARAFPSATSSRIPSRP